MIDDENNLLLEVRQLNKKFDYLLNRILNGGLGLGSALKTAPLLFDWLDKWLKEYHEKSVCIKTFKNDYALFKNHIFTQHEYNIPVNEFKSIHLQEIIGNIEYSRQRQIAANFVVAALRVAYDNDFIAKDITINFKKPLHTYASDRAATYAEQLNLLVGMRDDYMCTLFKVYLYSGLRRNEGLGLQRKHLDFENSNIIVQQQATANGGITAKLKTKTSARIVKMFPQLKKALSKFISLPPETRLFNIEPETATKHFTALCNKLGIQNFSIKSLRATFATRCAEHGVSDLIIQLWLGHSNFKTTKTHYIKLSADYIENEFKKAIKIGQK